MKIEHVMKIYKFILLFWYYCLERDNKEFTPKNIYNSHIYENNHEECEWNLFDGISLWSCCFSSFCWSRYLRIKVEKCKHIIYTKSRDMLKNSF